MKNKFLLSAIAVLLITNSPAAQIKDSDGNTYNTVQIGVQSWITGNLYVSHFRNGDPIPEAKTAAEWKKAGDEAKPAWCYYDNNPANAEKYGRLYNWYAVNDSRGLAPQGWHIPTVIEWKSLIDYLGGDLNAGSKMGSPYGWTDEETKNCVTNSSGFAAVAGGIRDFDNNSAFSSIGYFGYYWSLDEHNAKEAGYLALSPSLFDDCCDVTYDLEKDKRIAMSVRCLKDKKNRTGVK